MSYDDLDALDEGDEDSSANTFVTFLVEGEEYAVEVRYVTEIVRLQRIFAVPDVPAYIRGVINLRGKVIPLVDVRARFGFREEAYSDRTVVLVIESADTRTGLIVDAVSDVVEIPPTSIEPAPARASRTSGLVRGVGKRAERVSFILDVPPLLAADEMPSLGPSSRPERSQPV